MDLKEKGRRLREKLRSKKTAKILVAAAVVAALAAAGIISLTGRSATANAEVVYQVASLKTGTLKKTVSGSGTLEAASETPVLAPVALSVTAVRIEEGQSVRSGDVVADIDVSTLYTAVSALRAEIDSLDRRIANLSSGSDSAETVKAPVSGRVKQAFVQPDDEVNDVLAQKGALLVISADGRLSFSFTLKRTPPPRRARRLRVTVQDAGTYDGTVQAIATDKKTLTVTITDDGPKPEQRQPRSLTKRRPQRGPRREPPHHSHRAGRDRKERVRQRERKSVSRHLPAQDREPALGFGELLPARRRSGYRRRSSSCTPSRYRTRARWWLPATVSSPSAPQGEPPCQGGRVDVHPVLGSALSLKAAVDGFRRRQRFRGAEGRDHGGRRPWQEVRRQRREHLAGGKAVNGVTTYGVNISVDGDALRIGMNATADIVAEERAGVLMVPPVALQKQAPNSTCGYTPANRPQDPAEDPGNAPP